MTGRKTGVAVDVAKLEKLTSAALMSWADLARASGISATGIRYARSGKTVAQLTVRKIAAALHVDPQDIVAK